MKQNQKRKHKIVRFYAFGNNYVVNNIVKEFLKLIDEHFSPQHKLHKIRNKNNTFKYCCLPNLKLIMSSHNYNNLKRKSISNQSHAIAKIKISAH